MKTSLDSPDDLEKDLELREYRRYVELMFAEKSQAIISNRNTAHARIIIETLVTHANDYLYIFCENLCAKVYGRLPMAIKIAEAANRGVNICILSQNDPEAKDLEERLKNLCKTGKKPEFRRAPEGGVASSADFNFVVSDDTSFRFELDRENHGASACANNKTLAKQIAERFRDFWDEASSAGDVAAA